MSAVEAACQPETMRREASHSQVQKLRQKNQVATFLALSIQNAVRIVQALARQRRRAVGNDPALRG